MDDMTLPSTFSNLAHQYVYKTKKDYLFCVRATVKPSQRRHALSYLMRTFSMTAAQANDVLNYEEATTGFVIEEAPQTLTILTCAHLFKNFYSADHAFSVVNLREWFDVSVICQHYEQYMFNHFPNLYAVPFVEMRRYTTAAVIGFDHTKDLMSLRIAKNLLSNTQVPCRIPTHKFLVFFPYARKSLRVSMMS